MQEVDVSKFTFDTPVLIKIMSPIGVYVPELKTYIPLETYASVEQVICILNRGIQVIFPKESSKNEISKKIEDMILLYKEKDNESKSKFGYVGTDINKALDTIQDINDSHIPDEVIMKEIDDKIFEYSDVTNRIVKHLSDNIFMQVFNSDDFKDPKNRINEMEREKKSRERLEKQKKFVRKISEEDAKMYIKFLSNNDTEYQLDTIFNDINYTDFGEDDDKIKKTKHI